MHIHDAAGSRNPRTEHYPTIPGYKGEAGEPSQAAATAIKPVAKTLRAKVLDALAGRCMTADEIAADLGRSPFSVRPRVAELHATGKIERAEARGLNQSGMTASRWRVKEVSHV